MDALDADTDAPRVGATGVAGTRLPGDALAALVGDAVAVLVDPGGIAELRRGGTRVCPLADEHIGARRHPSPLSDAGAETVEADTPDDAGTRVRPRARAVGRDYGDVRHGGVGRAGHVERRGGVRGDRDDARVVADALAELALGGREAHPEMALRAGQTAVDAAVAVRVDEDRSVLAGVAGAAGDRSAREEVGRRGRTTEEHDHGNQKADEMLHDESPCGGE